ncbi:MAG: hypothetical protein IJ764_07195 [Bacteroidales bacterium]|nr:hypothetical protein [Bacteroidales bacterium]
MASIESTIAGIESKVHQLVIENDSLRIKVQEAETTIARLQENINLSNQTIKKLTEENHQLLISRNRPTAACDRDTVVRRIEALINTIDESLTLLGEPKK